MHWILACLEIGKIHNTLLQYTVSNGLLLCNNELLAMIHFIHM